MDQKNCRLCGESCRIQDLFQYQCSKCGSYNVEPYNPGSDAGNKINSLFGNNKELIKKNIHNIRGYLKENEIFTITSENLNQLINLRDLKPLEKLKKLLLFLYKQSDIGETLRIVIQGDSITVKDRNLIPIIWAKINKEVIFLIDELVSQQLVNQTGNPHADTRNIKITTKGYEYIDKIENTGTSDIGFCAMWFDASMDDPWNQAIYPAIKDSGYLPQRIDIHDHNNVILEEIEGLIKQSKFIVADLTKHRGGVYFEAGFAKAMQKTIIYTCEHDDFDNIHFDIKHFNCFEWRKNDLQSFKEKLQSRIANTLGKGSYFK